MQLCESMRVNYNSTVYSQLSREDINNEINGLEHQETINYFPIRTTLLPKNGYMPILIT
jgi:hypothetical protein